MRAEHPLALRPGMTVGPWHILAPLGSGSFGIVFQVEHAGQRHALKFALRGPGSDDLNHTDARAAKELACLLQAIHPNVARVWAHGRWPDVRTGYHYVVMDFVEGATLNDWVKQARPSARRVARLFARLARTLGELHARDVFHRDLKPSNILVRAADEEPVLVDFGSADHAEALPLTESTLPPGTTQYRSPEALRFHREHHDRPDARYPFRATDDLYALGVTLHEVLTGTPAFSPSLPREVLIEHIEERLPPLPSQVNPRVPAELEAITLRLVQKRARERFPHGESLHAAFEEALRAAGPRWDEPLFPGDGPLPKGRSRNSPAPGLPPGPPSPLMERASHRESGSDTAHDGPRSPRLSSWHLVGAAVLLGLLTLLGWKRVGASHAPERHQAPVSGARPGAGDSTGEQPPWSDAGMDTREEMSTTPTTPGTPKTSAASPGAVKRALPACIAGVAAAASLHCASTTYATPVGEHPRRNEPCSPNAMRNMDKLLRKFRGTYSLPLIGTAQLDYHQDYVDGDVLVGGLRTGAISSIVRNPGAFPSGTILYGWAWVNGENAEIQWFEADVPRFGKEFASRITVCARVGDERRRTVRHAPGSTSKEPVWVRTDDYVVVDQW
ncbi:serine/threonine protein kinase [Pyxidicoccus parkwayensis]|uniref:non-specific serine/threonine protein kinase n=1 Tax=Pyxidicoccus parkwayensis TaxID=2813578 RepID=A0ABX7NZM3_9BACT|nr:serine/threonine-protein kinase [Pyxidicoccus parkwaysis]QSQ21518.1 serine/threonine protein kinase [Pyxidicoccus parkwaysis]